MGIFSRIGVFSRIGGLCIIGVFCKIRVFSCGFCRIQDVTKYFSFYIEQVYIVFWEEKISL